MAQSDGTIPMQVEARFTAAEARVYPLALSDPDRYEVAIRLVGAVAQELRRSCADVTAVLDIRDELVERLPSIVRDHGLASVGLSAESVVDTASALRCRELGARVGGFPSGVDIANGPSVD